MHRYGHGKGARLFSYAGKQLPAFSRCCGSYRKNACGREQNASDKGDPFFKPVRAASLTGRKGFRRGFRTRLKLDGSRSLSDHDTVYYGRSEFSVSRFAPPDYLEDFLKIWPRCPFVRGGFGWLGVRFGGETTDYTDVTDIRLKRMLKESKEDANWQDRSSFVPPRTQSGGVAKPLTSPHSPLPV